MFKEAILAVMTSMPSWKGDVGETPEQRLALYDPTARAILIAANETDHPVRAASVLLALYENESMGARYVLEGRCLDGPKDMRCDYSALKRRPLARGPFQVREWCKEAWSYPDGSFASILGGARCALHYVGRGIKRCSRSAKAVWAAAFATYRGQNCSDGAKVGHNYKGTKYARSMVKAESQLKKAIDKRSKEFHDYLKENYGQEVASK